MTALRVPTATYRLQFHGSFKFRAAEALAPYLNELGITDLYASPLFKARRGSLHGYSVTNPMELNPELGSLRTFDSLARKLKNLGMGLILDIIPNHMALSPDNPWWMEVLENGPASPYAIFFDIDWHPPNRLLEGKLLLPILGRPYGQVLEDQELRLTLEPGGFFINYYEHKFPLTPKTYHQILAPVLEQLLRDLGEENPATIALMGIISLITNLPPRTLVSPKKIRDRQRDKEVIKKNLWLLYHGAPEVKKILDEALEVINGRRGDPASFNALDRLLQQQPYRLAFWQVALELINYRRFFSINDLIGIRIEDPQVFEAFKHSLLFRLVDEGKISGLRIDHIDGLYDPLEYLQRLQDRLVPGVPAEAANFYIVVEKILAPKESLPAEWPVAGTTGYDFLNNLNGVFVEEAGLQQLTEIYRRFVESPLDLDRLIRDKKKLIMKALFGGEVENFVYYLSLVALQDRQARDLARGDLTEALVEVLAALPVYRTYIRSPEVSPRDFDYLEWTFKKVRSQNPHLSRPALDFLQRVLSLDFPPYLTPEAKRNWLDVVMRLQQFTGPVTAKGFEDTVLYIYNPLISLNEVGGDLQAVAAEDFHRFNQRRQQEYPGALNATSTHDTKRSEDVRARLHVLSEVPREWESCLKRWNALNQDKKIMVAGNLVPDRNQEIFLYQTMLGAWPLQPVQVPAFRERLKSYMIKAAREAMVHTRWVSPQVDHENALVSFIDAILEKAGNAEFLADFLAMQSRLAYYGALNSLSQVLLKIASPGVPDFYQGTELWDFSLVDPDNRRPVDFARRVKSLQELTRWEKKGREALLAELLGNWQDGRLKLYVTRRGLLLRRNYPDLFRHGDYLPLTATGNRRNQVLALARRHGNNWALAVAGRFFAALTPPGQPPTGREVWEDSVLLLPPEAPVVWRDIFTGKACEAESSPVKSLPLHEVLQHLPVAFLWGLSQELRT
jgi:(1->4)-alpha-D-glucan 1-alpha-D-glucosylmutase